MHVITKSKVMWAQKSKQFTWISLYDAMMQCDAAGEVTSESGVLMAPIAVVWEGYVFMCRITVVPKYGRPQRLQPTWRGFDAGEV